MRDFLWKSVEEGGASHFINQKVVSRLIDLGGLGLGNLILHSKTLLAKSLWCFLLEPNALWNRVISTVFIFFSGLLLVGQKTYPRSKNSWKAISSGYPFFSRFVNLYLRWFELLLLGGRLVGQYSFVPLVIPSLFLQRLLCDLSYFFFWHFSFIYFWHMSPFVR